MWGTSKWGIARWGVEGAGVTASGGTSWNPNWATDYGPDVDKAKKAPKKEVQAAIKTLKSKPVDKHFEEAVEIAKRSLASDLMKDEQDLITVMTAYYAHKRMMQDEQDMAAIIRLLQENKVAEKPITNSNSLIDKVVRNIPGVTPELMRGDISGHVTRAPGSTAASLLKFGTGAGLFTPAGLALGAIGSGIDSYNRSTKADKGLQATGIQATGPMGQDWTTSGIKDFIPEFLGGEDAEEQAEAITEEVEGLRDEWFELDNRDASGAGVDLNDLPYDITRNNSNYGSRTNLNLADRAHFSIAPPSRSLNPTNTAINQFYDRETREYVNMVDGTRSPDWDGRQVIDSYNQANQRVRMSPITVQNLAPPPGAQSQWRNPNNAPPIDLNAAQAQVDNGGGGSLDGTEDWTGAYDADAEGYLQWRFGRPLKEKKQITALLRVEPG